MKRIILRSLELNQFQKFDYYKVEFSETLTQVSGDNGTGKTTLYTALMWLMFGKDCYGRKEFDIRRSVNGSVSYETDASVIGVFTIVSDDQKKQLTLKRSLHGEQDRQDVWHDTTLCYVDEVPKLVGEYQDFINSLIPEEEFKMLTSVNYFLSLDTATQREYLCQMAGIRKAEDVIADNERLLSVYSEKPKETSLEDYIKLSKDSLKRLKDDKKVVQPSIQALVQSKPKEENWEELQQKKTSLEADIHDINEQLTSLDKSTDAKVSERARLLTTRTTLQDELSQLQKQMNREITERNDSAEREYNEAKKNVMTAESGYNIAKSEYKSLTLSVDSLETKVKSLDEELNELMKKYNDESQKEFSVTCPITSKICAHLADKERVDLEKFFNEDKRSALERIMSQGRAKKHEYDSAVQQCEEAKHKRDTSKSHLDILEQELASLVMPTRQQVNVDDIKEKYAKREASLDADIKSLSEEIEKFSVSRDDSELKKKQKEKMSELEDVISLLAKKEQIARIDEQIAKITENGRELADKIVDMTTRIEELQEINRLVVEDASKRINSLFQITHWETSTRLKNGSFKDICRPSVDGISASLNTATRINVGIDLCTAISNYKQTFVPLFVDSKESVNNLVHVDTQLITLSVAPTGTPLTISAC